VSSLFTEQCWGLLVFLSDFLLHGDVVGLCVRFRRWESVLSAAFAILLVFVIHWEFRKPKEYRCRGLLASRFTSVGVHCRCESWASVEWKTCERCEVTSDCAHYLFIENVVIETDYMSPVVVKTLRVSCRQLFVCTQQHSGWQSFSDGVASLHRQCLRLRRFSPPLRYVYWSNKLHSSHSMQRVQFSGSVVWCSCLFKS